MKVIAEGRELLERLADRHCLDGVMEIYWVQEGALPESPAQKAFALLYFGLPIYRQMAHDEYFPARSRSARRIGARGVRDSLGLPAGERAVIFMSHAVPAYAVAFWECAARRGDIDDSSRYEDYHGSIRALLQEFYPLNAEDEHALADGRREVDVFTTHVPVDAPEFPSRTGYNMALMQGRTRTATPGLWKHTQLPPCISSGSRPKITRFVWAWARTTAARWRTICSVPGTLGERRSSGARQSTPIGLKWWATTSTSSDHGRIRRRSGRRSRPSPGPGGWQPKGAPGQRAYGSGSARRRARFSSRPTLAT